MVAHSTITASVGDHGGAEVRFTLLIARFVAGGYAVYALLLADRIREQVGEYVRWWTPVSVLLVFLPALWLARSSIRSTAADVRWPALAAAGGYAVASALWPLAWDGHVIDPATGPPWIVMLPGLPALAVATVCGWRPAIGYVVLVVAAAEGWENMRVSSATAVPQMVWAIGFSMVFVVAIRMILRTGRLLDVTRRAVRDEAAAASARQAQEAERARFDAMTHDWVMSALLSASRNPDDPQVAHEAADAIDRLESLRGGTLPDTPFDRDMVIAHLRSVVAAVDPTTSASIVVTDEMVITDEIVVTDEMVVADGMVGAEESAAPGAADQHWRCPADVIRALGAATGEAVRNSVRHTGAGTRRSIVIALAPASVTVTVDDDGSGFDVERIAVDRLGIAAGITQQMASVPGGTAAVISAPGRGTRVRLGWSAP